MYLFGISRSDPITFAGVGFVLPSDRNDHHAPGVPLVSSRRPPRVTRSGRRRGWAVRDALARWQPGGPWRRPECGASLCGARVGGDAPGDGHGGRRVGRRRDVAHRVAPGRHRGLPRASVAPVAWTVARHHARVGTTWLARPPGARPVAAMVRADGRRAGRIACAHPRRVAGGHLARRFDQAEPPRTNDPADRPGDHRRCRTDPVVGSSAH